MSRTLALSQADRDLNDIGILRKTPSFEKYFLRRLEEKRDDYAELILHDDTADADQREAWRLLYKEYQILLNMLAQDEASAIKLLGDSDR